MKKIRRLTGIFTPSSRPSSTMTTTSLPSTPATHSARSHYNAPSTDTFYTQVWGGEDIHMGIYALPTDTIATASARTVAAMASTLASTGVPILPHLRVLDLGAGYGGAARWLAKTFGCSVTCLNLSFVQNERNKAMNRAAKLSHLIDVVEGSFEDLPPEILDLAPFDIVWSQDSFLHSEDREKIVAGIDQVLARDGRGRVIFTDLMASKDAFERQPALMGLMMDRLGLSSLGAVEPYTQAFMRRGFQNWGYWDGVENFAVHYRKVGEELERRRKGMKGVDGAVLEKQALGIRNWVRAAELGCVDWGIFCFGK
ncbi:MAG: hypothetical protein Q9208_002394 [Pyrenodesmia sp. 3 TL-2023]